MAHRLDPPMNPPSTVADERKDGPLRRGWERRNPFTRWPRASDAVLAALVFAATLVTALSTADDLYEIPDQVPFGVASAALIVLSGLALFWRRRFPVSVLAVELGVIAVYDLANYPELFYPGILIAVYGVGRYAGVRYQGHGYLAVGATATWAVIGSLQDNLGPVDIVFTVSILYGLWFFGQRLRLSDQRQARLRHEQEIEAERAVAEERTHIARELHDIVAHRVSMMTVQAGAAKTVAPVDPQGATQAMAEVEQAGRQALGELRHLLNVLRPTTGSEPGLVPQPGVADIPQLVADHADAGMDVELHADDMPTDLSRPADLYAYRIVQESLTNVFKHAGPTARTEVHLGTEEGDLVIHVTNTGVAADFSAPGYGIVGMRERAQLLGGSLQAQPRPQGGFRVEARLPMETGGGAGS